MIRAIRPNAMAQDDASMISGWNVSPNVAYTLVLFPGAASCGVLLYDDDGSALIASGAALTGTDKPAILTPQTGQTIGMVDEDLGWHLLLTTTGAAAQRTIRIGPAVDLPDEIHPVYGDDDLALARATAAIDAAAHYIGDMTVSCPLGLGAGLGDVVSVPVDGVAIVGQVESITWTAAPDGATEQAVIRRHVAIAPESFVEVIPPTVADDTGTSTHLVGTSGNVLANDEAGLTVVAVNGLSANVGEAVAGDNGGLFTIAANGVWSFDPDGDFALLEGAETADTSVTYHASDGTSEARATVTVTVSAANTAPVAVDDAGATHAEATTSGNVLTNDTDADDDDLVVSKVAGSAGNVGDPVAGSNGGLFTIGSDGAWSFDPDGDFSDLTGEQTATTSVTYHVSDGEDEDEGTLTVTVSAAPLGDPLWEDVALLIQAPESGSTIVDATGKSVTAQGNTAVSTALGYPTIYFDGNGDRLDVSSAGGFNFLHNGSNWTIEFIINPSAVTADEVIFDTARGTSVNAGIYLGFTSGGISLQVFRASNNSPVINASFNYTFLTGTAYTVTLEWDFSLTTGTVKMYVNGVFVTQADKISGRTPSAANHQTAMVGMFSASYPAYSLYGHLRLLRITEGIRYGAAHDPVTWPAPTS